MAEIIWTAEAERWLGDIFQYIARDDEEAALGVVVGIYERVGILDEFPEAGQIVDFAKPRLRVLLYGHYRIVYRLEDSDRAEILGVFHGALDLRHYFDAP